MLLPQEWIRAKRDGKALSAAQIDAFVAGLVDGRVSEAQAAAMAMAIFFQGMSDREQALFTHAMTRSGTVLDWRAAGLDGYVVDKHSTGGVGDKVSLMLAPIIAACGAYVPMISGRGLGHTGGTLDKLAAIPGYDAAPGRERFMGVVREVGCAIIGQTDEIAPADRRLYAIRDVTATVESVPLITASILSKKLAAGLDGLVMDVKVGNGAFMADAGAARALAANIVKVAAAAGTPARALLTDMNEVLGETAGNGLEVAEAAAYLTGVRREARLHEVTLALAAQMLCLAGLADDPAAGRARAQDALDSGAAAQRFARMVAALGGAADFLERTDKYLPQAPVTLPVPALASGYVTACDARALGLVVVALGGGRRRTGDEIDTAVGLSRLQKRGTRIEKGAPLGLVHARDKAAGEAAVAAVQQAFGMGAAAIPPGPLVIDSVGAPAQHEAPGGNRVTDPAS
ncbi:MAG: thymidine phosphorylase [Pseudomonadota bacterium]